MVSYQDKHYINTSMYVLIFEDFAPALLDVSVDVIPQFLWDKPSSKKKCSAKHFYAGTLLNTNDTLPLL